jgi:hypothetical protein
MKHTKKSDIVKEMLQSDRETKSSDPAVGFSSAFSDNSTLVSPGLTKREYFAAIAMLGMLCNAPIGSSGVELAETSTKMADALIEALNK